MNEYDSNRILDLAKTIGYTATNNLSQADCYVLNTCHIREKATDKVYHDIGRLKKEQFLQTADRVKVETMKAIKNAMDPSGLFNPGVLLD